MECGGRAQRRPRFCFFRSLAIAFTKRFLQSHSMTVLPLPKGEGQPALRSAFDEGGVRGRARPTASPVQASLSHRSERSLKPAIRLRNPFLFTVLKGLWAQPEALL